MFLWLFRDGESLPAHTGGTWEATKDGPSTQVRVTHVAELLAPGFTWPCFGLAGVATCRIKQCMGGLSFYQSLSLPVTSSFNIDFFFMFQIN